MNTLLTTAKQKVQTHKIINESVSQDKTKIKLKKNMVVAPNRIDNNQSSPMTSDIESDSLAKNRLKVSRNRLHTTQTNHKHHEERYGSGESQYAFNQKKRSTITRINKGSNVSPEILKKYDIKKTDITNWEKVHIDILNSLNINQNTLSQDEWVELIKLRPELKGKISIPKVQMTKTVTKKIENKSESDDNKKVIMNVDDNKKVIMNVDEPVYKSLYLEDLTDRQLLMQIFKDTQKLKQDNEKMGQDIEQLKEEKLALIKSMIVSQTIII